MEKIGWPRAHPRSGVTTQPCKKDADQSDETDDRHYDHRFSRWTGSLRPIDKINPRDHDAHCQNRNQNADQGVAPAQETTNDLSIALDRTLDEAERIAFKLWPGELVVVSDAAQLARESRGETGVFQNCQVIFT